MGMEKSIMVDGTDDVAAPLVSVVMGVYNGMPYLERAIDSILSQSFRDFELLLVDDGSTDESSGMMATCAARDRRVRVIRQDNAGLTAALIRGVKVARGRYIARMDADDISLPDRLRLQSGLLEADPALVAVSCHIGFIDTDDKLVMEHNFLPHPRAILGFINLFANAIGGHGQMMFRKDAYERAGGYDPDFRYAQDFDLWSRMLAFGEIGQVDELLYYYRWNDDSISARNWQGQQDCRTRVSQRAYFNLTGEMLDELLVRKVGELWYGRGDIEIEQGDIAIISRIMRNAYRAYRKRGLRPRHARTIRVIVAMKFFEKAGWQTPDQPLRINGYLTRGLIWNPFLIKYAAKQYFKSIMAANKPFIAGGG